MNHTTLIVSFQVFQIVVKCLYGRAAHVNHCCIEIWCPQYKQLLFNTYFINDRTSFFTSVQLLHGIYMIMFKQFYPFPATISLSAKCELQLFLKWQVIRFLHSNSNLMIPSSSFLTNTYSGKVGARDKNSKGKTTE